MKRHLIWILFAVFIFTGVSASADQGPVCKSKYKFPTDCTNCHLPPFGIISEKIPEDIKIHGDTAYLYIEMIDFQRLRDKFLALEKRPLKRIIIDLFSHGGSVFDSFAMVAMMQEQEKMGRVIEIRARGLVASAGLIIMISGTKGNRYIDKNALVMFHELSQLKFFAVETPSDKEEEAKIFRMIQDNLNRYIALKTKISQTDLCDRIKKKEFWMDAETAISLGFADQLIN